MKKCKHCRTLLVTRKTKEAPGRDKKHYYYTAYYYCPNCKRMYLDDEFKVVNKPLELFDQGVKKPETIDVEIWTDGACINNGTDKARATWAFVSGKFENVGLVKGKQTNNTAEGYAIYHALLWAAEEGYKKIIIHSDSQITLFNLQKPFEKVKENQEIFALIHDLIQANNLRVWYKKVAGHAGDVNNERANDLAQKLAVSQQ